MKVRKHTDEHRYFVNAVNGIEMVLRQLLACDEFDTDSFYGAITSQIENIKADAPKTSTNVLSDEMVEKVANCGFLK